MNNEKINPKELIIDMHRHSQSLYDAELDIYLENEKIANWLFGLSTGGLVFASSRIDSENTSKIKCILIFVFISFILLLITIFFLKMFTRAIKQYVHRIKFYFDSIKLRLLNYSNQIEVDLKANTETIFTVYNKFLEGKYESGNSGDLFKNGIKDYDGAVRFAAILNWACILVFVIQYILIFILVLRSI